MHNKNKKIQRCRSASSYGSRLKNMCKLFNGIFLVCLNVIPHLKSYRIEIGWWYIIHSGFWRRIKRITKMAIEFKIKHGIILALSLTIVLLIGCISLVSYQMYKTALKSFSVQDTSTNLPEKMTDSNTIFNTTEDFTTETPFQETTTKDKLNQLNQVSNDQPVKDTIFNKTTPNITGKSYRCPKFESLQCKLWRFEWSKRGLETTFQSVFAHFSAPCSTYSWTIVFRHFFVTFCSFFGLISSRVESDLLASLVYHKKWKGGVLFLF